MTAEAALEAPLSAVDAGEALASAMNDAHSILQRLKRNIADGRVTMADMTALGEWVDRAARISKLAMDAGVEERRIQLAEADGKILAGVIQRVLGQMLEVLLRALTDDANRAAAQAVWQPAVQEIVPRELRAVTAGSDE